MTVLSKLIEASFWCFVLCGILLRKEFNSIFVLDKMHFDTPVNGNQAGNYDQAR